MGSVVCLFTGKSPFLLCSVIMRMSPPFKKTMRRGSSLKFTILRNYQDNCSLVVPTKSNIGNLLFLLNAVSEWATPDPWKQINPAGSLGTAPLCGISYRAGRLALHMPKWPRLGSPASGTSHHLDELCSTLRVKRFREENPLAICLLTQYVKCQSIHTEEEMWLPNTKLTPFTLVLTTPCDA